MQVIGNTLENCRASGIKIMVTPQSTMCGNGVKLPPGEDADEVSPYFTLNGSLRVQPRSSDAFDGVIFH